MDALVQGSVLTPIQLDSVQHPEHPDAGRALRVHAVSDGDFYGASDVQEIPSRSLSPTDLDGLELVPEKFRLLLRSTLGISSGGSPWDGQDLLHLGVVEFAGQRIYMAYALRQPTPGFGDRIRARANGAHPVLLHLAATLRYFHFPCPLWPICPFYQLLTELVEKFRLASCFHSRKRHAVNTRCSVVGLGLPIGFSQCLPLTNVNIQTPEPPSRFGLRLDV